MMRITLTVSLFCCSLLSIAQIKHVKLEVNKKEKYFIQSSATLEADTIIMKDSSEIVLNSQTRDNIIRAKVIKVGKGCIISGKGVSALKGKEGIPGIDQGGPCILGRNGGNGYPGTNGLAANNLTLYFNELIITGQLVVNLNGGDGGDGGDGGPGGIGGPGTRVCEGGNGGVGGRGATGGNGGDGGTLIFHCKNCSTVRGLINTSIIVKNYGGYAGLGGDGGDGGAPGLGPIKDGHKGRKGIPGKDGIEGKNGAIRFLSN